jgi:DNA-binding NtrC family response regulator
MLVRRFVQEFARQHDRVFRGISADAMQLMVSYPWPGSVRELRNLIESMVVLAPDHEIQPGDLPRHIRDGGAARLLPVHIGPIVRGQEGAAGRELEFIVRSLLELKLQVEELRRRMDDGRGVGGVGGGAREAAGWIGDVHPASAGLVGPAAMANPGAAAAIEPRDQAPPPNVVTIPPGTKMADIERAVIEAALKETRGNRRRAAELLGIGERTLYRKIKEYRMPEAEYALD